LEARGAGGRLGAEPAFVVVVLGAVVSAPVFARGKAFAAAGVGGAVVDSHFEGCCLVVKTRIERRLRLGIECRLGLRKLWMREELLEVLKWILTEEKKGRRYKKEIKDFNRLEAVYAYY
jgi:hypothetical protein